MKLRSSGKVSSIVSMARKRKNKPQIAESSSSSNSVKTQIKKIRKTNLVLNNQSNMNISENLKYINNASNSKTNKFSDKSQEKMDDGSISGDSESSFKSAVKTRAPPKNPKNKFMKPIVIDIEPANYLNLKNELNTISLDKGLLFKKVATNKVNIITQTTNDKNQILNYLTKKNERERKVSFHTYTEKEEKSHILVLKNHYYVECTELKKILKDNEIHAIDIGFLNKSKENPSYLVHFKKEEVDFQLLRNEKSILDHVIVRWEKFDVKKKRIAQCKNCQLFGHAARNCGRSYRCVKCVDNHLPGQCPKITRDEDPTCVNCRQKHAANSKRCPSYQEYKKKISTNSNTKFIQKPRTFQSTRAPWADYNQNEMFRDFPPINPNYNNVSNINNNDSNNVNDSGFKEFSNLQKDFSEIQDIKTTMNLYKELISKLKSTDCHKTRIGYILEYTLP